MSKTGKSLLSEPILLDYNAAMQTCPK